MNQPPDHLSRTWHDRVSRRRMLERSAAGFGSLALASLMHEVSADEGASAGLAALAPKPPHHPAKAKACIMLFMCGGPSQVDLFDPKPTLEKYHGQRLPKSFQGIETQFLRETDVMMASQRKFAKRGQSGLEISDFLPHTATIADDIAVVRSCHSDSFIHETAQYQLMSGRIVSGHPSLGSWLGYGLGCETRNLPAYVVLLSRFGATEAGRPLWSSGYLPVVYDGTVFRGGERPLDNLTPPAGVSKTRQQALLQNIIDFNSGGADPRDTELAARIASYELAFRMQTAAPEAVDLSRESKETQDLYGVGLTHCDHFARQCLMARRLVERGVRFVLVLASGGSSENQWDAHSDLEENHGRMARLTDQPTAALVKDLKRRGMFDETLVVWGGEFGRTPLSEGKGGGKGRDHNPHGYSMWLAGGGIKGGTTYGATDEIGLYATENKAHVRDIHATILHTMGLNHESLEVLHDGRFERLTDIGGRVIHDILA
ncbi:MAG: DUF1501 domain-containing protein [bacterium]